MADNILYDNTNPKHIAKSWRTYINTVETLNPLLENAFQFFEKENIEIQTAFDIGCGPGNESNFLVEKGIEVSAFDYNPECLNKIIERFPKTNNSKKFNFVNTTIEKIDWKPVDLIVSIKVLPFLSKDIFYKTIEKIKENLNKNGVLVLNFFGVKDDWQDLSLVTKAEVAELFKAFEFLHFEEKIGKKYTVDAKIEQGHLIELVAKRRSFKTNNEYT